MHKSMSHNHVDKLSKRIYQPMVASNNKGCHGGSMYKEDYDF